jgi:hypothetical protein
VGHVVYDTCYSLQFGLWDRGFECHSAQECMSLFFSTFVLPYKADPLNKESKHLCVNDITKPGKREIFVCRAKHEEYIYARRSE